MTQDVRGLINCCSEQVAYVEGHHGQKASIKGVVKTTKTFHIEHRGHCEFCGAEWVALYSHLTKQIEYRRVTDAEAVSDDQG